MNKKIYINREVFVNEMLDKYSLGKQQPNVSDIGAGFGFLKAKVEALGANWKPFDYVRKIDESHIWDLNNPCPILDYTADLVVFLEVLEHLYNPFLGLKNIADHMKKGGVLILSTPNPSSAVNTVNLVLKGELYAFQKKHLMEHHVFTPWKHIVVFFLEQLGFTIIEDVAIDVDYQNAKTQNIKHLFKKQAIRLLEKRNEECIGMSYGLVAVKN